MDALTVTLTGKKLTFSRDVYLGSTYAVTFAGDAASMTGLALYVTGRDPTLSLATSVTVGEATTLALNTDEIIGTFRGCSGESIGFCAWLANDTGTAGEGALRVLWSPLVVDIETGTAAALKGDTGVGIESVARGEGTTITVTYTDGSTQTLDISDLKGDKGDTGNVVGETAAGLIAALADGEPANIAGLYADIAALKSIFKALNT